MVGQRVLSGNQPTADSMNLGNYLGAMAGMLDLQREHKRYLRFVELPRYHRAL